MKPEKIFDNYFGGCPSCGGTHGFLNVGADHWFVCHDHKTKWCCGSNLFSAWQEQTEAERRSNAATLAHYEEVEPIEAGGPTIH